MLVLDEPTSMLDDPGRREVLSRVDALRGGRTIVHVTHHLDELLGADRVVVLNAGRVAAETTPAKLVSDPGLLAENRLVAPPVQRLAAGLGLGPGGISDAEDLARAVLERLER